MSNERPPILRIDWRYRVATTLAEDFKSPYTEILHKKGTPFSVTTFVKHGDKSIIIGDPSAPALFLSQSNKAYQQAIGIHPFASQTPSLGGHDPSSMVYDYLELIMASIVFAYTAIEAFANEEIPEDFTYEMERSSSRILVAYEKESIERRVSLDEKLAIALPKAKGKPSPKGLKIWEDYVTLRRLRDRIVHLKSCDRDHSKNDELYPDSIWTELLKPKQDNHPLAAKNMMLHFRDEANTHWLKYCPF